MLFRCRSAMFSESGGPPPMAEGDALGCRRRRGPADHFPSHFQPPRGRLGPF